MKNSYSENKRQFEFKIIWIILFDYAICFLIAFVMTNLIVIPYFDKTTELLNMDVIMLNAAVQIVILLSCLVSLFFAKLVKDNNVDTNLNEMGIKSKKMLISLLETDVERTIKAEEKIRSIK